MKKQIRNNKSEIDVIGEISLNNLLPNKIHQMILGSLLGDMHCRKECVNSKIEEGHSIKQKEYLLWKHSILEKHFVLGLNTISSSVYVGKNKTYIRTPVIRFASKVSEKLNPYHNMFYKNGKKMIDQIILDQLDSFGLAVWYCDDGYYGPENKSITLHTEGFSIEENYIIKNWFNKQWGIDVNFKKDYSKKKVALRFTVKDSDKFLRLIKKHISKMPQSMWYKLGHLWEGNFEVIDKAKLNKLRRTKIYQSRKDVKIRRNQQVKKYYRKNREKVLKQSEKYRKTKKYKDYLKEYHQKPGVRERINEWRRLYIQKPKVKKRRFLYQEEYRKRPEVKIKIKEYNRIAREKRKGDKN